MRKMFRLLLLAACFCMMLAPGADAQSPAVNPIDMTKWSYNADDDVYYQLGIPYCAAPVDESYETLAVFVPGTYLVGRDNGDGTWSCTVSDKDLNGYTAATCPIVMPINTPGYSAMAALTDYSGSVVSYTDAGFVYVHAGCRGRDAGAPAGVTDLKAAVRFLRCCDDVMPGDAERIFTFGMSGGGAQSALMGSTGDSALYTPYLEQIGAVMDQSDAVYGSMCWCPITNLDTADLSYEWMMGATRSGLTDEEQAISDALANAWAAYINSAGIKDRDGTVLTLEESGDGLWQSGSYYELVKSEIERSLNNFLFDTSFPYDASANTGRGGFGGRGGMGGGRPDMGNPPEGFSSLPGGGEAGGDTRIEDLDNIARNESSGSLDLSGTYETAEDYIAALNANGEWVSYDPVANSAGITSVEAFVKAFKPVSKKLGAFDQLDGGQGENTLFGYADGSGAHFDATLAGILSELGSEYAESCAADLSRKDSAGYTVLERLNMYTPLYYLLESSEGWGTSTPAKYWRIRTGIAQSDTALTTELNLALALQNDARVEGVDFESVWAQKHVEAERSGSSSLNFIAWVNSCMAS